MSKYLVTVSGVRGIFLPLLTEDNTVNVEAMVTLAREKAAGAGAEIQTDFDSVATEINTHLLASPGTRNISTDTLIRAIWEARIEDGKYVRAAEETVEQFRARKDAEHGRLEEVLPSYVKSATDRFHVGRKSGILVRFVEGEKMKDQNGDFMYDGAGNEVQAFRHTTEEWTEILKKGEESAAKKAAKDAAK